MNLPLERLKSRLAELERKALARGNLAGRMAKYLTDPVGYARDVLKVEPTADQAEMFGALLKPPYRVKARAGHSVGKTFAAACAANWWYDTRNPGVVITTAPTLRDVVDLLWTEVRLQRRRANLPMTFIGPAAPEMRTSEEHWAKGYTARKGESFQGRHRSRMLFIFDEDEGIDPVYWRTTDTMFVPDGSHAFLTIGNPTTTTSQAYLEEQAVGPEGDPKWKLLTLSCLNHPNVEAGLAARPLPVPNAVTVEQVDGWVADWCTPIHADDRKAGDVEWRPGSGRWWRPGPVFEARVLGRRPTLATDSVWSEADFALTLAPAGPGHDDRPEIGCDVARFGDDWTVNHGRCGPESWEHEAGNGWAVDQTVGRVIDMAKRLAERWNAAHPGGAPMGPKRVKVKVDDDGVGGGVTDLLRAKGMAVVAVNAGTTPRKPGDYRLKRDELWFGGVALARMGRLSLARLERPVVARIRQQALNPKYTLDVAGRRCVESKDEMKKRIGRSPDDMDAVNLAYCDQGGDVPTLIRK